MGIVFAKSFPHLLSGSYGLAEGSNVTNADTAVLALSLLRGGNFASSQAELHIGTMFGGYYILSYAHRSVSFMGGSLRANRSDIDPGWGFDARCENLSLIFSPKAMGWSRELERTWIRQRLLRQCFSFGQVDTM